MKPTDLQLALETVPDRPARKTVPTGSYGLDLLLGGGWPFDADTEIHGPPMSGKSALVYSTIAAATQRRETVLLYDDGSYSPRVAQRFTIDDDYLVVTSSLGLIGQFFNDQLHADLIVFDHLRDRDEAKDAWDLMCPCTTLYVTQEREQLVRCGSGWVSAGPASGWISEPSVRVRMSHQPGNYYEAAVELNDRARPTDATAAFRIGAAGIDDTGELLDLGLEHFLVYMAPGSRFWLHDEPCHHYLGHGRDQALATLDDRPDLLKHLVKILFDKPRL